MSKLKLDLRIGESINFDDNRIKIVLLEKSGQRARLEINAKEDVKIDYLKKPISTSIAMNGINFNKVSK